MLSLRVRKICSGISSLKIQGARKIALAAIEALTFAAEDSRAKTPKALYSDLLAAADALSKTRPTEPMMRNSIRDTIRFALLQTQKDGASVSQMRAALLQQKKDYFSRMQAQLEKICEFGARHLPQNCRVLVHCHSHTVVGILRRAQYLGKRPIVVCTETRPLFQGRKTAAELAAAGIDVSLIVDSAANSALAHSDLVLVGADAITASGDLVNKIGTSSLAQLAYMHGARFYSAAELYKFDPATRWGAPEPLEQRGASELGSPIKGVKFMNPAFDITPARYVSAYICEEGIIPPQGMLSLASKVLGEWKEKTK